MEFKEFGNPEQKNYDVKVGINNAITPPLNNNQNNELNGDEGIDLNALDDAEEFILQIT